MPLNTAQMNEILNNIKNKQYDIVKFANDIPAQAPNHQKMIESGEEVDMGLVTSYTDANNEKVFVSFGALTST